jgi:hypothetical protein
MLEYRFVRQPNSLFACFSGNMHAFIYYDLNENQAVTLAIEYGPIDVGRLTATEMVLDAVEDVWSTPRGEDPEVKDGLNRWRAALVVIQRAHGQAVRDLVERYGSDPIGAKTVDLWEADDLQHEEMITQTLDEAGE